MHPTATSSPESAIARVGDARWLSFHVFCAGDRDALLLQVVQPVVAALWAEGMVDRFFFIRYREGGEHLRLRLRIRAGKGTQPAAQRAAAALQAGCAGFCRLLSERGEGAPAIEVVPAVFELEVDRYGGPGFFPDALSFFGLSSMDALQFVAQWSGEARARQLTEILVRLTRQAIGLSRTAAELRALADYVVQWRPHMASIVARADQMFESRGQDFTRRTREVFAATVDTGDAAPGTPAAQTAHARGLAAALDGLEGEARWRAMGSQMHMAANRLGLNNPEESYLSGILCRCLDALGDELDDLMAAAAAREAPGTHALATGEVSAPPAKPLDALVAAAMRTYFDRMADNTSDAGRQGAS